MGRRVGVKVGGRTFHKFPTEIQLNCKRAELQSPCYFELK